MLTNTLVSVCGEEAQVTVQASPSASKQCFETVGDGQAPDHLRP